MNCKNPEELRIKNISVKLTQSEFDALEDYCAKHEIKKSDLIRNILLKEISKWTKQILRT